LALVATLGIAFVLYSAFPVQVTSSTGASTTSSQGVTSSTTSLILSSTTSTAVTTTSSSATFETSTEASDSEGLVLSLSDNAQSGLLANQSLQFTASLYNPSAQLLNLSASQMKWDFPFVGFPLGESCSWGNSPYEFVVLQGYYNTSSLSTQVRSGAPTYVECHAGGPASWYGFDPQSSEVTLEGILCAGLCDGHTQSITSTSNATVTMAGYYISNLPHGGPIEDVGIPFAWTPGANYTLAVGDAWGGLAILHFEVLSGSSTTLSPYVSSVPRTTNR
jgi:hypothetical protein